MRLVSRNPKAVNRGDELLPPFTALLVDAAVAGSEVVYLCPGLLYKAVFGSNSGGDAKYHQQLRKIWRPPGVFR